jgi:hypothetical protein
VPDVKDLRKLILSEAHDTAYSIHPGSTKMYYDLKERFWWYGMKRSVAKYVAICDTCQRVKAEHQRPAGLLQPMKILEWKWEEITMDIIVVLPRTQKGYNSIWVVVDRLTKVAHFIPVKLLTPELDSQSCTSPGSSVCMVFQRRSYLIEDLTSLHGSRSSCMIRWIRSYASVPPVILKQMGRQREPTKCWRICFEPALLSMVPAGINACHSQSFHITIAIRPV